MVWCGVAKRQVHTPTQAFSTGLQRDMMPFHNWWVSRAEGATQINILSENLQLRSVTGHVSERLRTISWDITESLEFFLAPKLATQGTPGAMRDILMRLPSLAPPTPIWSFTCPKRFPISPHPEVGPSASIRLGF